MNQETKIEINQSEKAVLNGVVCPCDAHASLLLSEDGKASCEVCGHTYSTDNNIWDLNLGERFDDEKCECMWCNEESTGRHLVDNYIYPLLQKSFPDRDPASIKILSIGCGVGSDVEALNELQHRVGTASQKQGATCTLYFVIIVINS